MPFLQPVCDQIEVGNLKLGFTRDESMRITEIIIINHDEDGEEGHGMRVICRDDGFILGGVALYRGVDIVGHAEMQG